MINEWLHPSFSLLFIVVGEVLIFSALLHMIYQRRSPTSMISWLLAIVLLPHIAVPLYFILGSRKRRNPKIKSAFSLHLPSHLPVEPVNPIDAILQTHGIPGATQGNRFVLYTTGVEAYTALITHIQQARESIFLCTYVFHDDAVTARIIETLSQKAREGVQVKLLIDSLGSWPLYFNQRALQSLRQAGGEVAFFMPILRIPFRNYINLRNHRKIYLFDQQTVLTGGMNLSHEYLGPTVDARRWHDLLFCITGPAVFCYNEIFHSDWAYATGQPSPPLLSEPPVNHDGMSIQVAPSGPDIEGDALFEALLCAIYSARQRIWIVTPYFAPDSALQQALIIAHHKGVQVKLITPGESNHLLADLVRGSYMRELIEAGIEVALYQGTMLHAKAMLFDDDTAMLGSVNIDNRSLFLNYEVVSFTYSPEITREVGAWMETLLAHSRHGMKPAGPIRRLAENLMRIVAPQL